MACIVVCGFHRSGTSLVASLCQALGVHIGDRLLGAHPSQPRGHWENIDFYELNMAILKAARGDWQNPPCPKALQGLAPRFASRIQQTIAQAAHGHPLWGWKDPRTCLTLPLYLPHLEPHSPRFLLVTRDPEAIYESLRRRSGGTLEKWRKLHNVYTMSLADAMVNRPYLTISYDHLTCAKTAEREVHTLATWLGNNGDEAKALQRIEMRS